MSTSQPSAVCAKCGHPLVAHVPKPPGSKVRECMAIAVKDPRGPLKPCGCKI